MCIDCINSIEEIDNDGVTHFNCKFGYSILMMCQLIGSGEYFEKGVTNIKILHTLDGSGLND